MIDVLVVDDDFMVARLHSKLVERVPGFTVVGEARTGAEALALEARQRFATRAVSEEAFVAEYALLRATGAAHGAKVAILSRNLPQYGIVLRRSQGSPAARSTGPVTPRARQPVTSRKPTSLSRRCQIG